MPKLATFPKAYLDEMGKLRSMTIRQWLDLAVTVDVDGLEFFAEFYELEDESNWPHVRRMVDDSGLGVCMMCASPDFTHPDPGFRQRQIGFIHVTVEKSVLYPDLRGSWTLQIKIVVHVFESAFKVS